MQKYKVWVEHLEHDKFHNLNYASQGTRNFILPSHSTDREKHPLDCSGSFFLFLRDLFTIFSMVSAADQNRRDLCDFSASGNGADPALPHTDFPEKEIKDTWSFLAFFISLIVYAYIGQVV